MLVNIQEQIDILEQFIALVFQCLLRQSRDFRHQRILEQIFNGEIFFTQHSYRMSRLFLFLGGRVNLSYRAPENFRMNVAQLLNLFNGHALSNEARLHFRNLAGRNAFNQVGKFFFDLCRILAFVQLQNNLL